MSGPPERPKIYHITHVDNLQRIAEDGALLSDRAINQRGGPVQAIGLPAIKRPRLEILEVPCHPGTKVGDFVPFYFCPRSVMLFMIHMANHPALTYRGGQAPIVHIEADLHRVVRWADSHETRWCFSLSNAGARYTEFRTALDNLAELNWQHIAALDWRESRVKESKMAEFLLYDQFPFELVERIGALTTEVSQRALAAVSCGAHRPVVEILPEWYYL